MPPTHPEKVRATRGSSANRPDLAHGARSYSSRSARRFGRFRPPGAQLGVADVNGKATILIRNADGTPAIVVSIDVDRDRVQSIWAIANPDKLRRV
jgi:hypothetical protein